MTQAVFLTGHSGGSGKTFCNVNLAIMFASAGQRVLLADLDPLCGSMAFWGDLQQAERLESIQRHSVRPGLDLVMGLEAEDVPELYELLEEQYDIWMFDTGAPLDPALQPVYGLCRDVILLLQNEPLNFRTLPLFVEKLLEQKLVRAEQLRGLLLNCRERFLSLQHPAGQLEEILGKYLLPFDVPFSPLADRALLEQKTAIEFAGLDSDLGWAFRQLANILGVRA
ncbi:MAG TPA: ParA family protein [Candidatus Obscuribacterales bacterium]